MVVKKLNEIEHEVEEGREKWEGEKETKYKKSRAEFFSQQKSF